MSHARSYQNLSETDDGATKISLGYFTALHPSTANHMREQRSLPWNDSEEDTTFFRGKRGASIFQDLVLPRKNLKNQVLED